jgi:hypothetical protein
MVRGDKKTYPFVTDDLRLKLRNCAKVNNATQIYRTVSDALDRVFKGPGVNNQLDVFFVAYELAYGTSQNVLREHALGTKGKAGPL